VPVAELLATIAALEADNAKLRAERGPSPPEWKALKSVGRGPFSYEAARQWTVSSDLAFHLSALCGFILVRLPVFSS
jgi:hypothetical protein